MGVMLVPTAFTLLWMTIFGNSAIYMVVEQGYTEIANMVSDDSSVALFVFGKLSMVRSINWSINRNDCNFLCHLL